MVAHQLARGSEVTSSWNGIHSVFSVPLVPFERANQSAGKKRNEFRSTTPRLRILGKGQNWLMVAHQLASAYNVSLFHHRRAAIPLALESASPLAVNLLRRSVSIFLTRPLYHRAATAGEAFSVFQRTTDRISRSAVGSTTMR